MLLDALKGQNRGRPPIWMMRQAGRYLPEYRKLRERYRLKELFFTPELAAEITRMPVDILGVDAAILFSDITVVARALGFSLDFSDGPVIGGSLGAIDMKPLEPIEQTIRILKKDLKVPLIGFCGGPFTVASYMPREPDLLEKITEVSIEYLRMQEKAGVDCIQIFDSWANVLSQEQFEEFSAKYLKRLIEAVKCPVILFMRRAHTRMEELCRLNPAAISFDWEMPMHEIRQKVPLTLQGNLNPDLLYQPLEVIRNTTLKLLDAMRGDPAFIAGLGHGMRPDMNVDAARCLVDTVKNYRI